MGHGAISAFSVTIASGATLSSELDLGRAWTKVYYDITGAASEVRIQAASTSGGTYRQVAYPAVTTSTVATYKIASSASGSLVEGPSGLRFIKLETTATVSNGATLKVICSDE